MPAPPAALGHACNRRRPVRAADARPPADNEYLLAHQEYSPTAPIQGLRPYLRAAVADATGCAPVVLAGAAARARRSPGACCAAGLRSSLFAASAAHAAGRGRRMAAARGRPPRASSTTSARSSTSTAAASRLRALMHLRRRTRRAREDRQPRRPGARGDSQQRAGPLLLPRCEGGPHRAAQHRATRFPSLLPQQLRRTLAQYLSVPQGRERAHRRPRNAGRTSSSPRTACATATSSGPTSRPGCCSRRTPAERTSDAGRAVRVHRHPDRRQDRPRHGQADRSAPPPPDWEVRESLPGDVVPQETGWLVKELPAGIHQDRRGLPHAARRSPHRSPIWYSRTDWSRCRCSSSRRRRRRSRSGCLNRAASTSSAASSAIIW